MDIDAGSLVYSIAGRDKGGVFVVVEQKDGFCYLVDGKVRKCDKPKKKKQKHVKSAEYTAESLREKLQNGERLVNSEVRKSISTFYEKMDQSSFEGGLELGKG